MASTLEKEVVKRLECGICLERFEEPRMLVCQHFYCKKCLERLVIGNEITCPECRRKTEVPSGDVTRLQSNLLLNSLLSIRGNSQTDGSSSCRKHDGEKLQLFCCNEFICRDCALQDHRNHGYTFIKDIFPAEKAKVLEIVQKSRANIRTLESSIETITEQEEYMRKNSMDVASEIDNVIDTQIELLERKRQSIKDDLRKSVTAQNEILGGQMESFLSFLGCLKSSVEFTEEVLNRGSEVEILSAKSQMIQELTELNSATSDLKPRGQIYYTLEVGSPLDDERFENIVKIRQYDKEYGLTKKGRESFGFVAQTTVFRIRPKSKCSTLGNTTLARVKIIEPNSEKVHAPAITSNPDGSFSFGFHPDKSGDYRIEVLINGRYIYGSPFTWEVANYSPPSEGESLGFKLWA